jgi:hypothetical protein
VELKWEAATRVVMTIEVNFMLRERVGLLVRSEEKIEEAVIE